MRDSKGFGIVEEVEEIYFLNELWLDILEFLFSPQKKFVFFSFTIA